MVMPVALAVITYLFFYSSGFNFAEMSVFALYNSSVFFLIVIIANALELLWPQLESRYVELPAYVVYNMFTYKSFFSNFKAWVVILKSVLCTVATFLTITSLQDFLISRFT